MIRFGIAGCGHIASKHIAAIAMLDEAKLHAVCDKDEERMQKAVGSLIDVQMYSNYSEMLRDEEIDVVIICTPSGLHSQMAIAAAHTGKHIVVEKPIALTLEDADAIIKACHENRVKLAVVHPNRYRPAMLELKRMWDEGRFGRISHVSVLVRWNRDDRYFGSADWRGTKEMDGGVLMNQGIHAMDLIAWLLGDATEVRAMTARRFRQIETEDVAIASLRFKDGALGSVEVSSTVYPKSLEEQIAIFGEFGTVVIGGGPTAHRIVEWKFESMTDEESLQLQERVNVEPYGESGHLSILRDMVQAIKRDERPSIQGEDGRSALKLVLDIYTAAEQELRQLI
ncbi:Gfo/Idh/MocA family oxidoreductase [Paenibacillus terrigena]|uniref:Gfo/Idh/MocA family protein n=1 Tax=Paenibacillus terrigena TaxID=369333 RepID=UPI0028D2700F|nr:Gfo/Idh/MocA family oxidoreductase [Paenibacillus terrigena]